MAVGEALLLDRHNLRATEDDDDGNDDERENLDRG